MKVDLSRRAEREMEAKGASRISAAAGRSSAIWVATAEPRDSPKRIN